MIIACLFWALALLCCGFAAALGGRAGRRIATLYLSACVATATVSLADTDWARPHLLALGVDLILLAGLIWVALRSDRWFPIWFAGLHLVAVATHCAAIVSHTFSPSIYFMAQAFWSLPMLFVLATGVALDSRAGLHDGEGRDSNAT